MNPMLRLAVLVPVVWLIAALLALVALSPPTPLVGARVPGSALVEGLAAMRPDLDGAAALLEKVPIWGVARDGGPLSKVQAAKDKADEEKVPQWWVVASVVRPDDRYVVVAVEGQSEQRIVRKGETLPDGSVVLDIETREVALKRPDGAEGPSRLSF